MSFAAVPVWAVSVGVTLFVPVFFVAFAWWVNR